MQNDIIKQAFSDSRCINALASEEEDNVEHVADGNAAAFSGPASSGSARHVCRHAAAHVDQVGELMFLHLP